MAKGIKQVALLGAPTDIGAAHRGAAMGPEALRVAELGPALGRLGLRVDDLGDLSGPANPNAPAENGYRHLPETAAWCQALNEAVHQVLGDGAFPIVMGGDHCLAIGSIAGVARHCAERGLPLTVLWLDAHADFNTPETSPSGNTHGMALSILLGQGYPRLVNCGRPGAKIGPEDVVMIGIRELDPEEKIRLSESGITVFTMRDIDEKGMGQIAREALCALSHHNRLHVSMDMDALSPENAPGVGTPVPGGLTYREAHLLMEIIADSGRLSSMDIVEINPIMDTRNTTATMAVHLAVSLFGKQIF